jgi:ribose 5-phosphate isomerase A
MGRRARGGAGPGRQSPGLGTAAAVAVEALARRHREGLGFVGIPSDRTAAPAAAAGIHLTSFATHRQIDLTIDGADEVEHGTLNLIIGLGGALLHQAGRSVRRTHAGSG